MNGDKKSESKSARPVEWFGPATVAFTESFPGNPYDPEANDVYVLFSASPHVKEKRLAYYDNGQWKATLVAKRPGTYQATLWRNGKAVSAPSQTVRIDSPIPDGFVRRGGSWGFQYDSRKPCWPLGHNLGWQSGPPMPDITECLTLMGKKGINWSRIWACHWDGKNPFWSNNGTRPPLGEMLPATFRRWDEIVAAARKAGVRIQFVLFHHGGWSSRTNPNWQDNPWNSARGGFLARAADFFTDDRARALSRAWLRYAVARYGHETCIMAWELFNEVEWVDAIADQRTEDVARWHAEMAQYLRSIDPYHHLVTTSARLNLPIWKEMDYYQPHGYPPSVASMILCTEPPKDKPLFYGEVGPGAFGGAKPIQVQAVRDGIWSALMMRHAGAGQYWTWELVFQHDLLREYELASRLIRESGILSEKDLKTFTPQLDAGKGADLSFSPSGGWEPTRQFEYHLPADASTAMNRLSVFLQGQAHRDMMKEPVRFLFDAPSPGTFSVEVVGVSRSGASLRIRVNDRVISERSWAGGGDSTGGRRFSKPEVIEAPFDAGKVTVELCNEGSDWVQLKTLRASGIGECATGIAIGNRRMVLARLQRTTGVSGTITVALSGSRLADGSYQAPLTDLDTGKTLSQTVHVRGGVLKERLPLDYHDAILSLKR